MNREQAGNILDAYVLLCETEFDAACDSLREVILDAMTSFKASGITTSNPWRVETVPCSYPTNWDGTPKVTCSGVDPLFKEVTA